MTPDEIHALLIAEAERRSLPECYKNDLLVHDLNWLHEFQSHEFIWILRTCGTFCFPLDCMDKPPSYSLRHNWPDSLLKYEYGGGDKETYYYHFSPVNGLKLISFEEAREIGDTAVSRHVRNQQRQREISALQASME